MFHWILWCNETCVYHVTNKFECSFHASIFRWTKSPLKVNFICFHQTTVTHKNAHGKKLQRKRFLIRWQPPTELRFLLNRCCTKLSSFPKYQRKITRLKWEYSNAARQCYVRLTIDAHWKDSSSPYITFPPSNFQLYHLYYHY